jgi:hypothetical protein
MHPVTSLNMPILFKKHHILEVASYKQIEHYR